MRNLLLILSGLLIGPTYGQSITAEQDSVQIFRSSYNLQFKPHDYTNLNQFQTYRTDFGPIPQARSGNLGLPLHYYDSIDIQTGINSMFSAYQPYMLNRKNINFYSTERPFTSLDYVNGAKKEQYFSAFHTQNFGPGMNFSFQYDRITSEGFFARQLTNHTRFNTNYHLQSRNGRFRSQAYFVINTIEAQENGGVFEIDDEPNQESNTVLLDIGLSGAQNRSRSQSIGALNTFTVIPNLDSSNQSFSLRIGHDFEWNKSFRNYQDLQSGLNSFYQNSFIDTTASADSSYADEFSNKFFLDFFEGMLILHARTADYRYFQNYLIQEDLSSQYLGAQFNDSLGQYFFTASLEKGISGFHQDEIYFNSTLSFALNAQNHLGLYTSYETRRLNPLMNRTRLNRFYYNVGTKNVNHSKIGANWRNKKLGLQLKIKLENYENLYYYGSNRELNQSDQNIQWLSLNLRKFWNLGAHFKMINQLHFQEISADSILPLPALTSFNSIYYENIFFKEALLFQVGIDFYFISDYDAYAYDPAQASFHLRSSGQKSLGNISQIDLFMNIRIAKSARIFIKMENAFQSPYDPASERIEDYPIPGRAIKFGLSWRMIN